MNGNYLMSLVGSQPDYKAPNEVEVEIPQEIADGMDKLFYELTLICPAWKHSFPSKGVYNDAKLLWLKEFVRKGVKTSAQIEHGLERAKESGNRFFPTVQEFIGWCKEVNYKAYGLPDEDELIQRITNFMGYGMSNQHLFKFKSDAEYWLIVDLYSRNRSQQWTTKMLEQEASKALKKMAKRIERGEKIPERRITLPEKSKKCLPAEELNKRVRSLRRELRMGFAQNGN
ncbi:holin [Pasteurellaceae bacterium HPA106]|uniref:replication protein P n=1 Tax=Spirabiliibacterium pneumoniae TaxID=221400 RepID=UPI001AACF405|nr:replication protein P [Spirabiliibacterium pneumoniae]MBE2895728.1 holin [Spirabiliibacterium pneumoniae]